MAAGLDAPTRYGTLVHDRAVCLCVCVYCSGDMLNANMFALQIMALLALCDSIRPLVVITVAISVVYLFLVC